MTDEAILAEADALARKYDAQTTGPRCTVSTSPSHELIDALLSRNLFATRISEILAKEKGERVSAETLTRHRKRQCLCPKD